MGPAVDAPRLVGAAAGPVAPVIPAVAPAVVVPVKVAGAVVGGLLSEAVVVPAPAEVLAGCVGGALSAGFPNSVEVAGWVLGAEGAAVPGVLAAEDLGAPRPENKPPPAEGAAAGVDDGVAEEVVSPRAGNSDLAGVVEDVAGVEEEAGVVVVAAPAGGVEKSDGVCGFCSPPARGAPKRGFEPVPALVAGGVDSAGLSLPRFEKRLPPAGAEGVEPSRGFCCVFDPKRPPPDCGCDVAPNSDGVVEELVAVVVAEGVVDEVVAALPKRPPGFCPACPDCPNKDCP